MAEEKKEEAVEQESETTTKSGATTAVAEEEVTPEEEAEGNTENGAETESEETEDEETEDDDGRSVPASVQRRFDELTAHIRSLERENARLQGMYDGNRTTAPAKQFPQDYTSPELAAAAKEYPDVVPIIIEELARRKSEEVVDKRLSAFTQASELPTVLDSVNAEIGTKFGSWRDSATPLGRLATELFKSRPNWQSEKNNAEIQANCIYRAYNILSAEQSKRATGKAAARSRGKQAKQAGAGLGTTASAPTGETMSAAKLSKLREEAVGTGPDSPQMRRYTRALRENETRSKGV